MAGKSEPFLSAAPLPELAGRGKAARVHGTAPTAPERRPERQQQQSHYTDHQSISSYAPRCATPGGFVTNQRRLSVAGLSHQPAWCQRRDVGVSSAAAGSGSSPRYAFALAIWAIRLISPRVSPIKNRRGPPKCRGRRPESTAPRQLARQRCGREDPRTL
jgi:hypothetical protein